MGLLVSPLELQEIDFIELEHIITLLMILIWVILLSLLVQGGLVIFLISKLILHLIVLVVMSCKTTILVLVIMHLDLIVFALVNLLILLKHVLLI